MSSTPSNRVAAAKHRQGLVREAARIIAQGHASDYRSAKRKALKNLGLPLHTPLPRNQDIEAALCEHQRLFGGAPERERLSRLRRGAVKAMCELKAFKPRLTGPVLRGRADQGTGVCLHLFADTVEEVGFFLMDCGIPFRHIEAQLDFGSGARQRIPGFGLVVDGVDFELLVFSGSCRRRTPLCSFEGRAMRRATLNEVRALLAAGAEAPGPGDSDFE